MRTTLIPFILGLAACHHSQAVPQAQQPASTSARQPAEAQNDVPEVDPTLPSWAPRSCSGYHTAVVQALGCDEIAQGTRDKIKQTYEARNQSWQSLEDTTQDKIDQIGQQCSADAALVRAEHAGKCGTTAQR